MGSARSIRTCAGCGKKAAKADLLRIVRQNDGTALLDPSGKMPGRGAYVCSQRCLEEALGKRKLDRALRHAVREENAELLTAEYRTASKRADAR